MTQSVIGALRVNLGLDSAQFSKGLKQARSSLQNAGRAMRNAGAVMSLAVTAPLVIAGRDMVRLAAEQEAAMTLVEQGVKTTGEAAGLTARELAEMASGLQEISKFGDEAILQDVTAQLLTFTNIAGEEFGRAQQAILDVATVMDKDLKSVALQVGKALNDPVKGISALNESGIQFTEDQKKTIKTLVEMGDVAAAQGLILDELANQFGGQAAAAAGTFDGKVQSLSNAWGDLKEEFGAVLIEILPPLIEALRSAIKWVQELDPATKEMAVKMGLLAAAIGPVLTALGLLVIGIGAIGAPVAAVVAGIAGLTAAIVAFGPEIIAAKDAVIQFGRDALEYIKGLPEQIVDAFKELPAQMVQVGREILDGLKQGLIEKYTEVKESITGFAGGIVDGVKAKLGIESPSKVFREIGTNIMLGLGDGLASTGAQVGSVMGSIADSLSDDISGLFKSVLIQGADFKDALANLLGNVGSRLLDSAVSGLFSSIPGFASGTSYAPGGMAWVGERGPELVGLPRGAQVIPNYDLGSMAGGMSVVRVELGEGLEGRILQKAGNQAVQLVGAGMAAQDRKTAQNFETYSARRG